MAKIIITSGKGHIDIDAYACIEALTELYSLDNDVLGVISAELNESIPKSVRNLPTKLITNLKSQDYGDYKYVIVDVSDPEQFADFVPQDKIVELFDHRWGFEKYWSQKLGIDSMIQFVGACATLIWKNLRKMVERKLYLLLQLNFSVMQLFLIL